MIVLLLGSGGREHALAWKLLQSPQLTELVWVPGQDAGLAQLRTLFPDKKISAWSMDLSRDSEREALVARAKAYGAGLTVVGPDQLLSDGIADAFEREGLAIFGPTRAAARLEWSKAFAKDVMTAANVPTAKHFLVRDVFEAETTLRSLPWSETSQWVLKADGLALGKGVEVCSTIEQALAALPRLFAYSGELVIEERLFGEEISWLAFTDGETGALLDPARDYKTLNEEGQGPNTGGMGAISPVPGVTEQTRQKVRETVVLPMIREMKNRGTPFRGVLYAGLMVSNLGQPDERISVLEFNARFGDPETQALLPRVKGDLLPWLLACAGAGPQTLAALGTDVPFQDSFAAYVVASAPGYPGKPETGARIEGVESWTRSVHGFFAGVKRDPSGTFVTAGGRVLGALGVGDSADTARKRAYFHLEMIDFDRKHFRRDIG